MSHRPSTNDLSADALTRALRDLPLATPPGDGWATLAASLRTHGLVRDAGAAADDGAAGDSDEAARPGRAATAHDAARSPERRRRAQTARRPWFAAGLAAALALAAVVLMPTNTADRTANTPPPKTNETTTAPAAAGTEELTALRSESSRIEEWLRTLKADETPLDGRSLMAATEIEDMIGLIDLQLAAGNDTSSDTQALWRERVELLRDLAAVRTTYSLAGTGIAANGTAAAPDNWTHL